MVWASELRQHLLPLALRSAEAPAGAPWAVCPAGSAIIHISVGILIGLTLRPSEHEALLASSNVISS